MRHKTRRLKGGLKLRNNQKRHFAPIIDMINSPSGQISLLTYGSLKGFMLTLTVSPDDTEYLGLSDHFQFTRPVTSFILKFAVITPNNDTGLPNYKNVSKASESRVSYFEEAKLQQTIWKRSIVGGRPEVCPPVANFSLFDNQASKAVCAFFLSKAPDVKVRDMFTYLARVVTKYPDCELGVIVMPKVENSVTFGEIVFAKPGDQVFGRPVDASMNDTAYAAVTAQVLRLYLDVGVIHFDLHTGNSLIYLKPDHTLGAVIIDFGRAANILDPTPNEYMKATDKQQWMQFKENGLRVLLSMDSNVSDIEKQKFVSQTMKQLTRFEHARFHSLFNPTDKDSYQMDWYESFPTDISRYVEVFDALKTAVTVVNMRIQGSTIKSYETNGNLVSFSNHVDDYLVPLNTLPDVPLNLPVQAPAPAPPTPVQAPPAPAPPAPVQAPPVQAPPAPVQRPPCNSEVPGMCTISGGRRKKRRTTKRRSKRRKRQRRTRAKR